MVLIRFASALAVASVLFTAAAQSSSSTSTVIKNPIQTPTTTLPASAMVDMGCFSTGTPLENHGPFKWQSPGNCQLICLEQNKNVMGLSEGTNCWCGDMIPAKAWQADNNTCDTSCGGWPASRCGGPSKIWVVLTGNTRNRVEQFQPVSSSLSAKPSSTSTTTSVPAISVSSTPSSEPEESKPNTAGIAAGVVVGIVALGAIIGGVWFFLRRRRQKQAEADYRRNAANADQFVSGGKLHTSNSSMNDSRLDPSFVDRRQSNGSIADNEDYSRRILKVTNV